MELKDFVSETITQIMDGIVDAQGNVADKGGIVNPGNILNYPEKQPSVANEDSQGRTLRRKLDVIDFEIALTEIERKDKGFGIGVGFSNIGIGGNKKGGNENASLNTVKFSVTVCFPSKE